MYLRFSIVFIFIVLYIILLVFINLFLLGKKDVFKCDFELLGSTTMDVVIMVLLLELILILEAICEWSKYLLALWIVLQLLYEKVKEISQVIVFVPYELFQLNNLLLFLDSWLLRAYLITQALPLLDVHAVLLGGLEFSFNIINLLFGTIEVFFVLLSFSPALLWMTIFLNLPVLAYWLRLLFLSLLLLSLIGNLWCLSLLLTPSYGFCRHCFSIHFLLCEYTWLSDEIHVP